MKLQFTILQNYGRRGKGYFAPDDIIIKTTKAIHLLFATAWAGGAISLQALSYIRLTSDDPLLVEHTMYCLKFVDTVVVMPGLFGCLITGLFYSLFTSIGFMKFAWIGFKWIVSIMACCFGILFLGPWGDNLIEYLSQYGLELPLRIIKLCMVPEDMWFGAQQLAIILIMCLISVYRPLTFKIWKKNKEGR